MFRYILTGLMLSATLAACDNDATVASRNISQAADNFEVNRRIVFYNGITGGYILVIEGRCSIDANDHKKIMITCKIGQGDYRKHYLGVSDNVTYFAEQMGGVDVSVYHYRVTFKPQAILPDINFRGSVEELQKDR